MLRHWAIRCPRNSQQDVVHTGHSQGHKSLGCPEDLPMGLWDRQDTGTTPKGGSPWDVPGTPSPFSGIWDSPIGNGKAVGRE